jgi:hypothetical protein
MDIHLLKNRLEIWKHVLFIVLGASITLFLQAVIYYLEFQTLILQTNWYGVWFIVQLAAFLPGFVLLWGKHWMQIPLHQRLNTIFGYFAITWFNLYPVGIIVATRSFNIFLLGGAMTIAICYWWLRRRSLEIQREIFP